MERTSKQSLEDRVLDDALDIVDTVSGAQCSIELKTTITPVCAVDGHEDEYTLTVEYKPNCGRCIEIESFKKFATLFNGIATTQEAITQFVAHFLFAHVGPKWVEVTIEGEHYGIHTTTSRRREE